VRTGVVISLNILLLTGLTATAQNPYIQHYTTYDGLPSNCVYSIYQDSKKFIWFATDAGVVRYDGATFTNFRKKDGLSSNEVIKIKEDSFGRIWFFNLNGRLDFFHQNKIFNETDVPALKAMKNKNFFSNFFQDKDSVIYFYNWQAEIFSLSPQNGVRKVDLHTEIFKDKPAFDKEELDLRYLDKNLSGEFIVWCRTGVFVLNPSLKKAETLFDSVGICGVFPAHDRSAYVFAYQNGILRFNDQFQHTSVSVPFLLDPGYRSITCILEDAEGYVWIVSFDHGVYCLKNNKVVRHFDIRQGQAVIQDNENNIWISSMKDGVYKISPFMNTHRHYDNSLFQNSGITAMEADPHQGVWLTNGKSIFLYRHNVFYLLDFKQEHTTYNMLCPLKNSRLIAGESGLKFFSFEGIKADHQRKRIYFTKSSTNLVSPKDGTVRISFKKLSLNKTGDELCSFCGGLVHTFSIQSSFGEIRPVPIGERIYNVFFDARDEVIINAKRNYLFRNGKLTYHDELSRFDNKIITDHLILNPTAELYNIDGDSIYLFYRHHFYNLSAAFVSPIDIQVRKIIYDAPSLYLATFRNIYKCDNPFNIIEKEPLTLQLLDVNYRNIQDILADNDSLYIASDDGLTVVPEAQFNTTAGHTPIPYFQSILVNDREMNPVEADFRLTGNKKITFRFSCINFSSTPILYSYRLEGMDTSWTTGTSRNVVYQNLSSGSYVFKMRVQRSGAAWSAPAECRFTIRAQFWQHPLFIVALFMILMGGVILSVIRRKNIQIKRRELDHQLITLEQKALQSMMNPHFIFNSLGSIQNYLLQKKSGEAGLYLSQFARLIRQNLNAINAASINLEEEIDRLKNYLDMERLRMGNKFEYTIGVDENVEADEVQIPSMIIQPFVENAIWHGLSLLEEPGMITIRFEKRDEKSLKIIIRDNGIGMKKSRSFSSESEKHIHMGIEMTRRRLELLGKKYSVHTSIEYCEESPGFRNPGTRVSLVVPMG
jgi:hypothetical protein